VGDAIRDGFLSKVSDNGLVHRLAVFSGDGDITRVAGTTQSICSQRHPP